MFGKQVSITPDRPIRGLQAFAQRSFHGTVPTPILQCSDDIIASEVVGKLVRSQIPRSEIVFLRAAGHSPN